MKPEGSKQHWSYMAQKKHNPLRRSRHSTNHIQGSSQEDSDYEKKTLPVEIGIRSFNRANVMLREKHSKWPETTNTSFTMTIWKKETSR